MELCTACQLPLKDGQARCMHCGQPVEQNERAETAAKTKHVYESICGKCGALLPGDCQSCLICGTARDEIPYEGRFPVAAEPCSPHPYHRREGYAGRSPDTVRRWGGGLTALLLVVVAAITGFGVWRQYFDTSSYRAAESVLYETREGAVMLSHSELPVPIEVTGIEITGASLEDSVLQGSPNGRYLALTTEAGQLYQIDFAQSAATDLTQLQGILLAEGLDEPAMFSENGAWLVYRTVEEELYATDYREHWQLDTGVERLIGVEGRKVLYTRREESGGRTRTDLYIYQLSAAGGEWSLLDRDIREILDWTPGFERVLYTAIRQQDTALSPGILCYEAKSGVSEILVAGVSAVLDASAAEKTAIYLVDTPKIWSYSQFVDDDLAVADAQVYRPMLDDYPELAEAVERYGEGVNLAEFAESEALIIEINAYEAAMRRWEEKAARDEIRRGMHSLFAAQSGEKLLMELWAYRSGASVWLDSGVLVDHAAGGYADAESGYVIYQSIDPASLGKIKLSDIWRGGEAAVTDLQTYYVEHTRQELKYARIAGDKTSLFIRSDNLIHKLWQTVDSGSGVYFTVGPVGQPGENDELFYASMRGSGTGAMKVARQVDTIFGAYRGGIVYGSTDGTISVVREGTAAAIGSADSKFGSLENGGQTLLLYESFTGQTGTGSLAIRAREQSVIAEDVVAYDYRSDHLVYLLKRNAGGGLPDLYVWQGGEARLLGESPRSLLHPLNAE